MKIMAHAALLATLLVAANATAESLPPLSTAALVAQHSYSFSFTDSALEGAGAQYRMLHDLQGFRHMVVEQDPVAMEDALAPEVRADAICGVEQATGVVRYLEELVALATSAPAREMAQALLDEARVADHESRYSVNWLNAAETPAKLAVLSGEFHAKTGSSAARMLAGLEKSAEFSGYYRRAEAGEYVGLYNNTVREEVLKRNFLERYHAAALQRKLPKTMFKFGSNHLYHGKNPTQAYPIGNLAHELAIFNGMEAYGLYVQPLGQDYVSYKYFPDWMRPLLPAIEPTVPTLVDLRALRPYQGLFRELVAPADQWQQRELINGYDALVLLPGSRPATRKLGGCG